MRLRGPLASSYPAAAALVVFALVPFLALSSASQSLTVIITKQLGMTTQAFQLGAGMANAAYAVGTVLAVQFAMHLPQRRMLLLYATLFVAGSVVAAAAPDPGLFIAGRVVQGLCTSLMLIAAVPPLVVGWPIEKLRWTVIIMNLCIFGAVAAGPLIGGAQASGHGWRPLFWIVAGVGLLAWVFCILTYEDEPAQDRSAPWDGAAVGLAASGCVAAFYGASELLTHRMLNAEVFGPLVGGAGLIVLLVIHQYRAKQPLLTVRQLATTIPVAGIILAVCAAAASESAVELIGTMLQKTMSPMHSGALFVPEFAGALLTAILFGAVLRTRLLHALAFGGMVALSGGIVVISGVLPPTNVLVLVGSGLIGVGVGASVAPALFIAGFSLRNQSLQRVFALVELLRAVAAFMVAPVLMHVAMTLGGGTAGGTHIALWICFGLSTGGALLAGYLYALGGVRPQAPDLQKGREGKRAPGPPRRCSRRSGATARFRACSHPVTDCTLVRGLLAVPGVLRPCAALTRVRASFNVSRGGECRQSYRQSIEESS